jgi:N-formylglutamate deformylase
MILHIPHSSVEIPEQLRNQIVLSDTDLAAELNLMTDLFTDEIYFDPESIVIRFPISRLIVDVERFPEDLDEPMSKVGMGMIYSKTAFGRKLKRNLQTKERNELVLQYNAHHQKLLKDVILELNNYGKAVIIDCHSFPDHPLPCDMDQSIPRPQICIGTDLFHTPSELLQIVESYFNKNNYDVQINKPYNGTLVPIEFYKKDHKVISIMIEINRSLYMDERTGEKKDTFESIKKEIGSVFHLIKKFQQIIPADD